MYTETSSPRSAGDNAKLQLVVPRSPGSSISCLTFYYHMDGSSMGTLNVFNGDTKIFTASGDHGYDWRKVTKTVNPEDVVSVPLCYVGVMLGSIYEFHDNRCPTVAIKCRKPQQYQKT